VIGYSGNDREIMDAIVGASPVSVTWTVCSNNDLAVTNIDRRRSELPPVLLRVLDLESLHQLVKHGGDDVGTRNRLAGVVAPSQSATRSRAAEPLTQLEVLLAVLLQVEDYHAAVGAADEAEGLPGNFEQRASLYALQSFAARRGGDVLRAVELGKRATQLAADARPVLRARAGTELALAYLDLEPPDLERAAPLLQDASVLLQRSRRGDSDDVADALFASAEHNLGFLCESAGEFDQAYAHYRRALEMKRAIGDLPYQISSERDTALMLILLDRAADAAPHLERFKTLADAYSDPYELAYFDLALGRHRLRQGRPADARAPLERACQSFLTLGDEASARKASAWLAEASAAHPLD
jgi:tetratricopeptide (TPR) repeat protein